MDDATLHRALIERGFDLVVVLDDQMTLVWVSPQARDLLGIEPSDAVGRSTLDFVHPDDRGQAMVALGQLLGGEPPADPTAVRVAHLDGSWRWMEAVGGDLRDLGDPDVRYALSLRDVTNRKLADLSREDARREAQDALRRSEERWRKLLLHAAENAMVIHADGRITVANPDRGLFGPRDPNDVLGQDVFDWVHPDDVDRVRAEFAAVLRSDGSTLTATFRARSRTEDWRWVEATATNMLNDPAVEGVVINYRDVTERIEAQRDAQRLLDLLESTEDLVGVCAPDGTLLHLNRAGRDFAGLLPGDRFATSVPGAWLTPAHAELLADEVLPALGRDGAWSGELDLVRDDGRPMQVLARMMAHRDDDGELTFFSWIMRDISERKQNEARLTHQATHDPLTGLPNRTVLFDRLQSALHRSARTGADVAVVFVDLDHFKVLNDSRGHPTGDRVLRLIAERLAEVLRPEDTIARFGGDEFVIILEGLTDPTVATEVAGRVQRALYDPFEIDGEHFTVGASIGIALASDGSADGSTPGPEALLHAADTAMYQAKGTGRGRVEVFDEARARRARRPWWQDA